MTPSLFIQHEKYIKKYLGGQTGQKNIKKRQCDCKINIIKNFLAILKLSTTFNNLTITNLQHWYFLK